MANPAKAALNTDQFRAEVLRQLTAANQKLNLLVEAAGVGDQLKELQLAEQLGKATDQLDASVKANHSPP